MRVVAWSLFGAIVLAIAGFAFMVWTFASAMRRDEPQLSPQEQARSDEADRHVASAKALAAAGRDVDALAEYDAAAALWPQSVWFVDRGQSLAALRRFDEAIALAQEDLTKLDPRHWTYGLDWGARWVEERDGEAAAVAWLRTTAAPWYVGDALELFVANWERWRGRPLAAIPLYERVLAHERSQLEIEIDRDGRVVAPAPDTADRCSRLARLGVYETGYLAHACADAGRFDDALRYGALSIEVGRAGWNYGEWEPSPGYRDAGSIDGRIARATAFLQREEFAAATKELAAADRLVAWGYGMFKAEVDALHEELRKPRR